MVSSLALPLLVLIVFLGPLFWRLFFPHPGALSPVHLAPQSLIAGP